MTQVFRPHTGLLLRLGLLAVMVAALAAIGAWRGLAGEPHAQGAPVQQPVPFSHRHHVGELGLDCRYCHTAVETAAYAGMPPVSTCMTCHSQLFTDQPLLRPLVQAWESGVPLHWNRVYALPRFVYFDHSIHVAKGVGCTSCHGRVDTMPLLHRESPLSMRWCLACHRAPEKFVRPRERVFDPAWQADDQARLGPALVRAYGIDTRRLTECSTCHR